MKCTKCENDKPEGEFRERKDLRRGYTSWCRQCENQANKVRYIPKEKKLKETPDPELVKSEAKKRMLKSRYSITHDEYLKLYENQNGKCAICNEARELGGRDGLYVDHCHNSGKVRGLLCPPCNSALGKFKDDIKLLNQAIAYLNDHQ